MKTITKSQYYTLIGLLNLSNKKLEEVEEIHTAVMEIVGEEDELGHSSDAVYCKESVSELLKKLGIKVK